MSWFGPPRTRQRDKPTGEEHESCYMLKLSNPNNTRLVAWQVRVPHAVHRMRRRERMLLPSQESFQTHLPRPPNSTRPFYSGMKLVGTTELCTLNPIAQSCIRGITQVNVGRLAEVNPTESTEIAGPRYPSDAHCLHSNLLCPSGCLTQL
ncbi:hypothetical protein LY76DRAFT_309502 [Colletotrichum caudatum]|nr:hypothetical protein LY76DRAFT_309502 [Colletotrichum caudatum]